jgi:hypothetical protein
MHVRALVTGKIKSRVMQLINATNPNIVFGRFWSEYWLKHVQPMAFFRLWFSLPFNGQSSRLSTMYYLASKLNPTHAIESGTYLGSSTYLFLGIPTVEKTFSIESNSQFHAIASERWQRELLSNKLAILHGDSREVMPKILKTLDPSSTRVIAYLDAHWNGDIPTTHEIESLVQWGGSWIAMIDDFNIPVPSGQGYGFDVYDGVTVGPSILRSCESYKLYLTCISAQNETGARRGTGYVFSKDFHQMLSESFLHEIGLVEYKI